MSKAFYVTCKSEATHIYTFEFQVAETFAYTAGQFVEVSLPINPNLTNTKNLTHEFTLSSSPTEKYVSITTRIDQQQPSPFKTTLLALEEGSEVYISEPLGDFVLPKLIQTSLIFVALGIGITPVRSIAKWLADRNEQRPIQLLYAVKNEEEILFQPEIEKAGIEQTLIVNKPSAAWGGEQGKITPQMIVGLSNDIAHGLIYISGPESDAKQLVKGLVKLGFPNSRIVTDYFLGYK